MTEDGSGGELPVPRLAFLGFCDRAETITEGHTAFWRTNLMGVSLTRVFYFFPTTLRGHRLLFAVYRPTAGDNFKLIFRGVEGQPSFDITMQIASFVVSNAQGNAPVVETEHTTGLADQGWAFIVNQIDTDIVVSAPGSYEVFLSDSGHEQRIATALLAHAPVAPYTPEEITAIKSDPLATKFVRMAVTCNVCGEGVKVYAGIEKSASLERQGFRLNQEITDDQFACSCGKTQFSLAPIKTGFHGLLRRNLNPQTDTNISAVRLYEKTALEEWCRQLLKLIRANTKEEDLQLFLESHPIFFHIFMPKRLIFKPPILTKYFADFAVLNARDELLLIEIEKPHLALVKKDGDITAGLGHAFYQVRTWMQVLNDYRDATLNAIDLKLDEVARVKGVIVAGRKPSDEKKLRLLRSVSTADIELFTYDDLLNSVTELIKQVASI
jgi:hypothetical protein